MQQADWLDSIHGVPDNTRPPFSPGGLKPRKIPPQNIIHHLRHRETHNPRPGTHFHVARHFHTHIFPNFSVINVEKPPCFLRKFSPDGRYFIAFSSDQTSLEIYEFQGPAAAEDLLAGVQGDYGGVGNDAEARHIRSSQLFQRFFKLRHVTSVAANGEHLNRECSLFTDDGQFVIVGSAVYIPEEPHPNFFDIYRNNESVSPNNRTPLEDYTLHLVELESGRLCDSRHFKCDKIFLSHNQGLYLYRDTLAVLSVQQQTIHIFQVQPDGTFLDVRCIGRFCYEDDQLLYETWREQPRAQREQREQPFMEPLLNSLKHRILALLFRRAYNESEEVGNRKPLLRFFRYFEQLSQLRMWKMQLLDENHLLIKYASEDVVTLRISDPNSQPSFFVVYNLVSTEVVALYENTSEALLELFEHFCDLFRNATLNCQAHFACSAASNVHARQLQQRFKQTIINAKFGGHTEAVKRLLAQLPISAQSYSSSPYLDLALFSYDDKWVSVMERPKGCGDHPIRYSVAFKGLSHWDLR